jgi:4-hydroxy-tetrahydrodipicolinate reductase
MTRVLIAGYKGRMGQALIACAGQQSDLRVVAQIDLGDDLQAVIQQCDVIIDFSFHAATLDMVRAAATHNKAMVIGTTGHTADEQAAILELSKRIPIVWASNYSTGVNVLFWMTRRVAEVLGPAFDLEVVEMHHRMKKDAPSGTAMSLAQILAEVRRLPTDKALRHGRHGLVGERTGQEIGMHSLRGGDVVGDHTVIFASAGERLELTHRAASRDTFANGALRAAAWVTKQPPGLYDMQHVLGLR